MQYVFIILIIILLLVLWSMWNEKQQQKKLVMQLKKEWGQIPQQEYTTEKLEAIKALYLSMKDEHFDVDDITWNDLDMDYIFMYINNTQCSIGEEYLYALLRKPCFSAEELKERNRLIHFFGENETQRIALQSALKNIGKLSQISIYKYINQLDTLPQASNIWHYLMALGFAVSIGLIFIHPSFGGMLTFLFFVNNIYQYYQHKAKIENYLAVFSFVLRLLDNTSKIEKLNITEIKKYTDALNSDREVFKKFERGSAIVTSKHVTGSILDGIIDYGRMLFHLDLIKFNSMLHILKKNREALHRIFMNVGFLDSMIAVASFRKMLAYYCEPELVKDPNPSISVTDLYHPLLEDPVPNTITENRSVLLTGSNASGKSTFIKTLAINAILSQTVFTSISRRYRANYFTIFSSMALRDSIMSNESYYIVEIKSLKRILDHINSEIPALCFVDEVLRGTNTLERIAASSRILATLAQMNALVFAATHDIELTHILEDVYANYHFQEQIVGNEVRFDYKLYPGRAVSKNAIKLLGMLGYAKPIIAEAEKAAEHFQITGEWSKLNI